MKVLGAQFLFNGWKFQFISWVDQRGVRFKVSTWHNGIMQETFYTKNRHPTAATCRRIKSKINQPNKK